MGKNDGLNVEVGITLARLTKQLARAEARMYKTANKMERDFRRANTRSAKSFTLIDRAVSKTGRNLASLRNVLIAGLSTRELIRYADAWTVAENKIAAAGEVAGRSGRSLSEINDIAAATRSGIAETADLYAKLLRATAGVAKSEVEVARATELVNKAFKAGGAAASEQAAGILQLAQGLSSGVLQGDELRSIRENAPLVAQAIADEFGVTIGKLKELGAEGELTSERVFKAILNGAPQIEVAFGKTNATIGEGFVLVKNAITEYVAGADDAAGASEKIGAALAVLADNIDKVVAAGGILAGVFIGPVLLRALKSAVPIIKSAGYAFGFMAAGATTGAGALAIMRGALGLLGGPLGIVIVALSALPLLTTSTAEQMENLERVSDTASTALQAYADASKRAADEQDALAGKVSASTAEILAQSRAEMQTALDDLKAARKGLLDDLVGNGIFDLADIDRAAKMLDGFEKRMTNGGNTFLRSMAEDLAGVADGSGDLAAVARSMEQIAGAGEEATRAVEQFDLARMDPNNIDLEGARAKLVSMAETIGLFSDELDAIGQAEGPDQVAAAFDNLRGRMVESTLAGRIMRDDQFTGLREMLAAFGDINEQIATQETALSANNAELQELARRSKEGEDAAVDLGDATESITFDGAISGAMQLVGVLRNAVNAARDVSAAAESALSRAEVDFNHEQIRANNAGNPLLAAAQVAAYDFNRASPELPAGTDSTLVNIREQERRATIQAAIATEEYKQQIEALRTTATGGGGGGGGSSDSPTGLFVASDEEIQRLEAQIEGLGKTTAEIARMSAEQMLLNEAKARGLELDQMVAGTGETLREQIAAQAAEIGNLTARYEDLNARTQFFSGLQDQLVDGFLDAIISGKNLAGTLADVAKQIAKAALQAAIFGKGPMAGMFGGTPGKGILSLFGFSEGGYTGDGGTHEAKGVVHGGEYVFSKAAVQKLGVPRLDALHKQMKGYSGGGFVGAGAGGAPAVAAAPKIINVLDPRLLGDYLATTEGETMILNTIRSNRDALFG